MSATRRSTTLQLPPFVPPFVPFEAIGNLLMRSVNGPMRLPVCHYVRSAGRSRPLEVCNCDDFPRRLRHSGDSMCRLLARDNDDDYDGVDSIDSWEDDDDT